MIAFPKEFEHKPVGFIAKEIKDIIKANTLSLDDLLAPAYEYWIKNNCLKTFHALGLVASQTTNRQGYIQISDFQEKITEFIIQKEDELIIWQLMSSQVISMESILRASLVYQKEELIFSLLNHPNFFLNESMKEQFFYDSLEYVPLEMVKKIITLLTHEGYDIKVTIGSCHKLFERCLRGFHFDTLDFIEKENQLEYQYMNELLNIALESVFDENFFKNVPIKKHFSIFNYLSTKSWTSPANIVASYLEQCGCAINNYYNEKLNLPMKMFDNLAQAMDLIINKKWVENDIENLLKKVNLCTYDYESLNDKFLDFYKNDYVILKEKRQFESILEHKTLNKSIKI